MSKWYSPDGELIDVSQIGSYEKHVAVSDIHGCEVSTVWLGLDHSFDDGPPLIFETMIFGGPYDQWQDRYPTMEEALDGHHRLVAWLENEGPWCGDRFSDRMCHLPPHYDDEHQSQDYDGRTVVWRRVEK